MKRLIVTLLVLSFALAGVSLAAADNLPKSMKSVDLKATQKVTDKEAKEVRGTALQTQGRLRTCTPGTCVPGTCVPDQTRDRIRLK